MKTATEILDERIAEITEKASSSLSYAQAKLELTRMRGDLERATAAQTRAAFHDAANKMAETCKCGNPLCQVRELAAWLRFYGEAVTETSA